MAGEVDFLGGTEMDSGSDVGVRPLSVLNASSMCVVCLWVESSETETESIFALDKGLGFCW